MDKLAPLLRHKFWILFGIAIITGFVGWWMGTGALIQAGETRKAAVKKAETDAKSVKPNTPNEKWTTEVQTRNEKRDEDVKKGARYLFEEQQKLQHWPASVRKFTQDVPYRGEIDARGADLYRTEYIRYARKEVFSKLQPFHYPTKPGEDVGRIYVQESGMPLVDGTLWDLRPPTVTEMWNAQEDLWLMESLFKALDRVNGGSDNIVTAPIKRLELLQFTGGEPESVALLQVLEGGGGGGAAAVSSGGPEDLYAGGREGFDGGGGGRGGQPERNVSIDLATEFGGTPDGGRGGSGMPSGYAEAGSGFGEPAGGDATDPQSLIDQRYIHKGDSTPYRTRGFYMELVMEQTNVPTLQASLESCKWPVQVTRVHQVDLIGDSVTATPGGDDYGDGPNIRSGGGGGSFGSGGGERGFGVRGGGGGGDQLNLLTGGNRNLDPRLVQEAQAKLNKAMREPYLVKVAIAGWMTIYDNPNPDVEEGDVTEEDPTAGQPSTPTVDPNTTADPNASTDATQTPPDAQPETTPPTTEPSDPSPATPTEGTDSSAENSSSVPPASPTPDGGTP